MKNTNLFTLLFAGLLTIGWVSCVRGQDAVGDELDTLSALSLEELMAVPVYAASRREQSVSEAPSSVTIVTADEIKAHGWRTLGDTLNSVPGMYSSNDRSYQYIGVRGFLRPGDYNSRLLVLVNGKRVNNGLYGGSGMGHSCVLDVDLIDRVEVVRGPSSSLYGTGAFFGVVNIITRDGADLGGAEAAVSYGSYDTGKARFTYGDRIGDAGEFLISGSYYRSDGQDLYFPEFDAPETNNGKTEHSDAERAAHIYLQILLGEFTLESSYAKRTKHNPTASWETIFKDSEAQDRDIQWDSSLTYAHTFDADWDLYALLQYQHYEYNGIFPYDWANPGDPMDRVLNLDGSASSDVGGEIKATIHTLNANTITLGIEFRHYFQQDQWNWDEGVAGYNLDDRRESQAWGLYAQDEVRLSDHVLIHAGLRYDYTSPLDQGDISPRAGLILTPTSSTVLKLLYGEAFRSPSTYELYYNDGGATSKANPDLDPEKMRTYEVVLEQAISEYIHSSLSVYHYDIEKLISQQLDPGDGLMEFSNLDEAKASGLELALQGRLFGAIDGRASYSFVKAEDQQTGAELSNSPQNMGKLHFRFPLSPKRLSGALEMLYTGSRKTLTGNTAADYVVVNATLLAHELPGGFELSASIYNLLNEKYGYPGSGEHTQDILMADERSFYLKLSCEF